MLEANRDQYIRSRTLVRLHSVMRRASLACDQIDQVEVPWKSVRGSVLFTVARECVRNVLLISLCGYVVIGLSYM